MNIIRITVINKISSEEIDTEKIYNKLKHIVLNLYELVAPKNIKEPYAVFNKIAATAYELTLFEDDFTAIKNRFSTLMFSLIEDCTEKFIIKIGEK